MEAGTLGRMGQDSSKRGDEWLAATLLRVVLGADVGQHDDNSRPSMYDLILTYPDGHQAAAEVVSTRDHRAIAQFIAAHHRGYTRDARLARSWRVRVGEGVKLNRVAERIVPLLQRLERDGVDRVGRGAGRQHGPDLSSARVDSCWSFDATVGHPPGFYLWPVTKGAAWPGDGDAIVRECDQFLSTVPDVSAKLAASGLSERHAVVVVTVDWFQLFASVEYGALPAIPPSLPEGVDCLWLITLKSPPIRAAYWLGDRTWRGTTLTADHLGMAELSAL